MWEIRPRRWEIGEAAVPRGNPPRPPAANNCYTRLMARPRRSNDNSSTTPEVMTISDLAAYLQVSQSSLYKLVQRGTVPGHKVGRHWRFHKESIDGWLQDRSPKAARSAKK